MPPKLPSKKHWRTFRRWKGWPEPPAADYALDVQPRRDTAVQNPKRDRKELTDGLDPETLPLLRKHDH